MRISVLFSLCTNCLRDDPCCPLTVAGLREVVCIGRSASGIVSGIVLRLTVLDSVEYLCCFVL
jgi:hypothetical protein